MTDQELLKLAAEAVGIELLDWLDSWADYPGPAWRTTQRELWNPLINDGDALRLAVKLKMDVCVIGSGMCEVRADDLLHSICEHNHDGNTEAATRRAIVRAAAELMQQR